MLLLLSTLAWADSPDISWDVANPPVYLQNDLPLDRNWNWSCDDPSDDWPLEQRCQVYDVTAGDIGSGAEVLLVDDDCGIAASDPTAVNYTYDVPLAVSGKRYYYTAQCRDSGGYTRRSSYWFFHDSSPPAVTITGGPADGTSTAAHFDTTCADDAFHFDYAGAGSGYQAPCYLYCALFDDVGGGTIRSLQSCDDFVLYDDTTPSGHDITGLAPNRYRFEVYGVDGVSLQSPTASWVWEAVGCGWRPGRRRVRQLSRRREPHTG